MEASHREAHRNAMVEIGGDDRAAGEGVAAAAPDDEAVVAFLDPAADRAEATGHGRDPVRFLDAELGEAVGAALPPGEGGGDEEDREFVDHGGDDAGRHVPALPPGVADDGGGDRLPAPLPPLLERPGGSGRASGKERGSPYG